MFNVPVERSWNKLTPFSSLLCKAKSSDPFILNDLFFEKCCTGAVYNNCDIRMSCITLNELVFAISFNTLRISLKQLSVAYQRHSLKFGSIAGNKKGSSLKWFLNPYLPFSSLSNQRQRNEHQLTSADWISGTFSSRQTSSSPRQTSCASLTTSGN